MSFEDRPFMVDFLNYDSDADAAVDFVSPPAAVQDYSSWISPLFTPVVSSAEEEDEESCQEQDSAWTTLHLETPPPLQLPPLPPAKKKAYQYTEEFLLPQDFQPSSYSVICGRTRKAIDSVGNRRLAVIASQFANRYAEAKKKNEKTRIVSEIYDIVQSSSACHHHADYAAASFVKYSNGRWYKVQNHHAREKIGTALRDALHSKYKSSTKSKMSQRRSSIIQRKKKQMIKSSLMEETTPVTSSNSSVNQGESSSVEP